MEAKLSFKYDRDADIIVHQQSAIHIPRRNPRSCRTKSSCGSILI